jgi:hypothetical protein
VHGWNLAKIVIPATGVRIGTLGILLAMPSVIPDATAEPSAYVAALLETLGDRDPVEVYGATVDVVRERTNHLDQVSWTGRPLDGQWSPYEIIGHLVDVDIVYGFRWRLVLTAESPTYPGYDEKLWATLPKPPPAELMEAFAALRKLNLALVRSLSGDQLRRQGTHGEQGPEDFELMVRKIAGHDLAHLDQLESTIAAGVGEGR